MKVIRLHVRGGPEAFVYEEAPQPHPEDSEVLVRVHAKAVMGASFRKVDQYALARVTQKMAG
jgi:NADPH:quinone reductase-like Zn-dependent oxidoreductase